MAEKLRDFGSEILFIIFKGDKSESSSVDEVLFQNLQLRSGDSSRPIKKWPCLVRRGAVSKGPSPLRRRPSLMHMEAGSRRRCRKVTRHFAGVTKGYLSHGRRGCVKRHEVAVEKSPPRALPRPFLSRRAAGRHEIKFNLWLRWICILSPRFGSSNDCQRINTGLP